MDILFSIITIFSVYGFYMFVNTYIIKDMYIFIPDKTTSFYIESNNSEEIIEAAVRWFYRSVGRSSENHVRLVLVDHNSTDDTIKIAKLLQREYEMLEIIEK